MAANNSFESMSTPVRVFILVFILAIVGVIYFFVFHSPLTDDIEAASAQHTALEDEQREAERRQEEYLRVTEELASREAIDRENKRILPEDAEMAAFLQDLNRVAELSGLEMKLVEPRPEEAEQLYVRLPVSLTLSGRFHQLGKFFYNVVSFDERSTWRTSFSLTLSRMTPTRLSWMSMCWRQHSDVTRSPLEVHDEPVET